jgi:hypothetical protein
VRVDNIYKTDCEALIGKRAATGADWQPKRRKREGKQKSRKDQKRAPNGQENNNNNNNK